MSIEQIKELSIVELKAMIFDENVQIENSKKNIEVLSQILNDKLKTPIIEKNEEPNISN